MTTPKTRTRELMEKVAEEIAGTYFAGDTGHGLYSQVLAALIAARNDALEKAAKIADIEHAIWARPVGLYEPGFIRKENALREKGAFVASDNISKNIRALKDEKP